MISNEVKELFITNILNNALNVCYTRVDGCHRNLNITADPSIIKKYTYDEYATKNLTSQKNMDYMLSQYSNILVFDLDELQIKELKFSGITSWTIIEAKDVEDEDVENEDVENEDVENEYAEANNVEQTKK
jgi:hypothetical protein